MPARPSDPAGAAAARIGAVPNRTHAAECRAVIAETVRRVLCEHGMSTALAGQTADRVHDYLARAGDVETLYVAGSPPRVSHLPPEDGAALPLPVGEWRRAWLDQLAALCGADNAGAVH